MAVTSLAPEKLQSAFEAFNEHSDKLEGSYRALQHRVETLTLALRKEQSARHAELVRKEKLGQRLSQLLETLPGAILVIDGEGVIRQTNSHARSVLNQPLIGRSWASIVKREVRVGGSQDGNIELCDGRWLCLSRRPLQDEPGEVILLADVTESRQIAELRQRQERLTCIGEMTAEFAHQVRTPLASAILYVSQLESDNPQQQRIAGKIGDRLNDLGRMVDDMLGFARGARPLHKLTSVNDVLVDVASTVKAQLGEPTVLQIVRNDEVQQVAADGDALRGALLNLVINADQAGAANIVLGAYSDETSLYITVSDDGPGISSEVLPHLFEPFFTTRPQGTGLGLAVVAAVAVAHDGEVTVESSDNGTRFTIRIPAGPACSGEAAND